MRVWDVHPGYLSPKRLLGQHVEIHAVYSVILNKKKGYANHPETIRWANHLDRLIRIHEMTVLEMELRGYKHKSPLLESKLAFPQKQNDNSTIGFIDHPSIQFMLLKEKYEHKERGRITLPLRTSQLWANYKYSVMARNYNYYSQVKKYFSRKGDALILNDKAIVEEIIFFLDIPVSKEGLINSLYHIMGYFKTFLSKDIKSSYIKQIEENPLSMVKPFYKLSVEHGINYLKESTYFSDVPVYYPPRVIS